MKYTHLPGLGLGALGLVACGSDDGISVDPRIADIQGSWIEDDCYSRQSGYTFRTEATVRGTDLTLGEVQYYNSAACGGNFTISINGYATLAPLDETTQTESGAANNIDVSYRSADITASPEMNALLASQGTTLQDLLTPLGFSDISNVPISAVSDLEQLYTIYLVTDGSLRIGADRLGRDASSPDMRHAELSTFRFVRP